MVTDIHMHHIFRKKREVMHGGNGIKSSWTRGLILFERKIQIVHLSMTVVLTVIRFCANFKLMIYLFCSEFEISSGFNKSIKWFAFYQKLCRIAWGNISCIVGSFLKRIDIGRAHV